MIYSEIVKYFEEGEVGISKLLDASAEVIALVEGCGEMLLAGQMDEDTYKTQLCIQTGAFNFLDTVYSIAQAYKEIEEDKAYCNLRTEAEASGKKLTADAMKVEAHRSVASHIRVRNVFESYVNRTCKNIITIQSLLSRIDKNKNYHPQEEK